MKKVSIIIPIYNGERYIDRCIPRLLRQVYPEFEIICIPNNCSDRTVELCEAWSKGEERVKVFVNEQKGTSMARKRGVEEAEGDYIVFMDCDDQYISDRAIQKMVEAIEEDGSDICQFDYVAQYPIQFLRRRIHSVAENKVYSRGEMLKDPFLGAAQGRGGNFNCSVCSKIYKSSVLKSALSKVQDALTCGDDMQLNALAFSDENVTTVSSRKEAYYVYRVGRGITTNPEAIWILLCDYQVTKMEIYEIAKKLDVDECFFMHLWSEVLFCLRTAVYSCLYRGVNKAEIVRRIEQVDSYKYVKIAKEYYRKLVQNGWLETEEAQNYLLRFERERDPGVMYFMCSEYSAEEYYNWCVETLPKQSFIVNIKKFIRRFA